MRGGGNLSDKRPLGPDGNIKLDHDDEFEGQFDEVVGNHRGTYAANNVYNPRPGYRYYLAKAEGAGRARTRALIHAGAEIVKEDDEEKLGDMSDLDLSGTQLDTTVGHREVVLLRFPLDKYNKFIEEKLAVGRRQLEAQESGEEFLSRDNISGTRYAPNKVIYNRDTSHGLTFGERLDD